MSDTLQSSDVPLTTSSPSAPTTNVPLTTQRQDYCSTSIGFIKKLTSYKSYDVPEMKTNILTLMNDNVQTIVEYIYQNTDKHPYDSPGVRAALSVQLILSCNQLIPYQLSNKVIKDLETLRKDFDHLNKWANPQIRRKMLAKESQMIKKLTEIDDAISLNFSENPSVYQEDLANFDLNSSVSTLNISATCPVEDDQTESNDNCCVM